MKIYEIGTGYTSIPAKIGAATEIVVEELSSSMIKQNLNVTILDIKDRNRMQNSLPIKEVYMPYFMRSADVKLGVLHKIRRVLYSIFLSIKLIRLLKNEKDKCILHFHNQYNLFFFLKFASKKTINNAEIVYTNHSYIWFGNWDDIKTVLKKKYFQEIYCLKHANKVFVLNKITANHLINKLNIHKNNVILIPNGVNTNKYMPLDIKDDDIATFRKKFDLEGKKVIAQIGSLCDRKNQLNTVKMMKLLLKENSNMVFILAGGIIDYEYYKLIFNFCKNEGIERQIRYLGELSPGKMLNIIYNIADATIFNSKSEGFSLVILESLSAGTPVFINSTFFNRMNMLESDSNGIIIFDSSDSLYNKINSDIVNSENRLKHSLQARSFIEINYSWDAIAKLYINNIIN